MGQLEAERILGSFLEGSVYPCWVSRVNLAQVSMTEVVPADLTSNLVVCIILTILSTVGWMLVVAVIFGAIRPQSFDDGSSLGDPSAGPEQAHTVTSPALAKIPNRMTNNQIETIMARFSSPGEAGSSQWYCSICLEERDSKEEQVRKVSLPCHHEFDAKCLKSWLKRGHSCPLCGTNLRALFDREGVALLEDISEESALATVPS